MHREIEFETLMLDAQGAMIWREPHSVQVVTLDMGGGISLELASIPGGMYQMGSAGTSGFEDERPLHLVIIPAFYLGRIPITQSQWQAVMGRLPPVRFPGPLRPIEQINWSDAREFCQRLARKSGLRLRLPSESEWEYACRAGSAEPFSCGATLTTAVANFVGEGYRFAQEAPGIYRHGTTDVASFPPNPFGLYDMHGNVWEWCADAWHEDYSGGPYSAAPWGGEGSKYRVVRGGSWHEPPQHCRSATRLRALAVEREEFIGMRVALDQK